jgi:hypothetical protein
MHEIVYLGVPYTHADPAVREYRVKTLCQYDVYLSVQGVFTVSPMHKLLNYRYDPRMPITWEWWREYSETLMRRCDRLMILQLPGWYTSEGTQAEIALAHEYGIDVVYVTEDDIKQALDLTLMA